jgi:hypothetical protein
MQVCGVFLMSKDSKHFVKKLRLEEMDCSETAAACKILLHHRRISWSVNAGAALHRATVAHRRVCARGECAAVSVMMSEIIIIMPDGNGTKVVGNFPPLSFDVIVRYRQLVQPRRPQQHGAADPLAAVIAPAHAAGSTVCIRRDDGTDRTLLRVRPTNSRSDDAFVAPKVVISG